MRRENKRNEEKSYECVERTKGTRRRVIGAQREQVGTR
jgi:hypothetical protein